MIELKERLVEFSIWDTLVDKLDIVVESVQVEIAEYEQLISEAKTSGSEVSDWRLRSYEELKLKLKACSNVEASILKLIG